MNTRVAFALPLVLALGAGACASAGGGAAGGGTGGAARAAEEERQFPPGTEPTDNLWTRSAALYLARASQNPRPQEKRSLYEQALNSALEGIQKDPGNPKVWYMAGQAYIGLEDYVGADSALDKAEEIYPRYVLDTGDVRERAWIQAYNRGIGRLQQGDQDGAVELFKKAALIYQGRPEAVLNLAATYANRGESEAAIEAYREALEILHTADTTGLDASTKEQWAEQEEIATFNLAQLLARESRYQEAADAYRDYLTREPDNITAKTNLAVALVNLEQRDAAMEIYNELLSRTDLKEQDYFIVGVGLFRVEAYDRSAQAFRKALELNPYNRDARYNLAQALYQIAAGMEPKTAQDSASWKAAWGAVVPEARRLVECDPYNRNGLALLAHGLARSGEEQEAVKILEQHRDLPFSIESLDFRPGEQGGATLHAQLLNLALEPGTPVTLEFTFLGADGQALGAKQATVQAPAKDQETALEVVIESTQPVAGYCYKKAG